MKKLSSRILALALALVMLSATCLVATAATMSPTTTSTVKTGVTYQKHTAAGDGGTSNAWTLAYNPNSCDYITMPFMGWAGTASQMSSHYTQATGSRYGYDVAGLINGGFFDMATGTHSGDTIIEGKVACASDMYAGPMLTFDSDGTFKVVSSAITFDLTVDGAVYTRTIQNINKKSSTTYGCFMYYDSFCGTVCDSTTAGTEIICNKVGGTELFVGRDLIGEVAQINTNSYGCSVGSNQFVLWLPTGSQYEYIVSNISVGETIKVTARETNAEAKPYVENCVGGLSVPGVLVQDGVNLTLTNSTIGTHAVNGLYRGWTAVGFKPDGTHVLFISSETDCYDLQNVAQVLINAGCNNVVRMDGGGSTAMYTATGGNVYNQGRAVSDVVMAVSRSSMKQYKESLGAIINELAGYFTYVGEPDVLANARTIYNKSTSVDADYQRAILDLNAINNKRDILRLVAEGACKLNADTCSDRKGDWMQKAVIDATAVYNNAASTDAECIAQIGRLNDIFSSVLAGNRISLGAAYDYGTVNSAYPDTGKKELTNGDVFGEGLSDSAWTGFRKNTGKVGTDDTGDYTEIYVDLGEIKSASGAMISAFANGTISAPKAIKVFASQDGENFAEYLTLAECNANSVELTDKVLQYEALGEINARYFVFRVYFGGTHLFVGEASIYGAETVPDTGVDSFETRITTDAVSIFNGALYGTLTHANSNLTYANSLVCKYDSEIGAYVVTKHIAPGGSQDYAETVPANGFIVAMHDAGWWNVNAVAEVGDIVCLNGIDLVNSKLEPAASIAFVDPVSAVTRKEVVPAKVFMNKNVAEVKGSLIKISGNTTASDLLYAYVGSNASITVNGSAVADNAILGTGASFSDDGTVYTTYMTGDLSGDANVSAVDYMLLKRGYLGSYELSDAQEKAGCITDGENLIALDYVKLKRAVLGTYEIVD
ncbi:MAG: phosphodiester glycosidase family protein [Clostridia bacterium]|nr:phosphodiester glycosidase family protein [Clostridia bacterium]